MARKYGNFRYIEAHGGTGLIRVDGEIIEGSLMQAARLAPSAPCTVVEINPERFETLQEVVKRNGLTNVEIINGDCNVEVPKLLQRLPAGRQFILCFVDPDGYMYSEGDLKVPEFTPALLDAIATFPRTELLMTLPLEIRRPIGFVLKRPLDPKSKAYEEGLKMTLGEECLKMVAVSYEPFYLNLLDFVLERYFQPYKYRGALLVKSIDGVLQYYLIFGSHNETAGTIMRNVMKKEWEDQSGRKVSELPPLDGFIFDDRLFQPRLRLTTNRR
jgi:three-Cys-motif partner protein